MPNNCVKAMSGNLLKSTIGNFRIGKMNYLSFFSYLLLIFCSLRQVHSLSRPQACPTLCLN
jgi:hypothetical protein